jgi:beta-N-acetylhexosaminidase
MAAELRQLIGRVLMVGIPGPALDDETRWVLERLAVGGVILFRRNIGTLEQLVALIEALHRLPSRPLVAIDHEGGRVLRLSEPFTKFPPMAVVGATCNAELAHRVGEAMGVELSAVGFDLNFAPVLDVHSNPRNPVIGDRAFSSDPVWVATMGIALMEGLRDGGVIACGKHFPGHGDTEADSHLAMPVVRRDRAGLDAIELVPFRAAIGAGISLLMTAHVLYPALDAERPATLSPAILGDLLRAELGFSGVIASDDLEMRAISGHHEIGDAAVQTLTAGADLLLLCADLANAESAATAIEQAVTQRRLDESRLRDAAARVAGIVRPRRTTIRAADFPIAAHAKLLAELTSI